jgi:hypothetical protein
MNFGRGSGYLGKAAGGLLLIGMFVLAVILLLPLAKYFNSPAIVTPTVPLITDSIRAAPAQTYTAAPTPIPLSTWTSIPTNAPTEGLCKNWSEITLADVGQTRCVKGDAWSVGSDSVAFYIKFDQRADTFYFLSYALKYPGLNAGTCVQAAGKIRLLGNAPVIILDEAAEKTLTCGNP